MDKVIECARALGEAIVASEEYKNMQVTEAAAMGNPEVAEAMGRYLELKDLIGKEMSNEDADPMKLSEYGREMDEMQQKLNGMEVVEAMTASRQNFSMMMNSVNKVLEFIITGEVAQQGGGCSGNCGSCGGCH